MLQAQEAIDSVKTYSQDILEMVTRAGQYYDTAGLYFSHIHEEVKKVEILMQEIIQGIQEITHGTGDIQQAITGIVSSSQEINNAINNVDTAILQNATGIGIS
jgi:methyl-accepting chemotaxis protein